MRYLYLDDKAGLKNPTDTYEMIYDALYNAPGGYEGPNETRTISRVFDKLERIGIPVRRNNQDVYELATASNVVCLVSLEDAEFTLVERVLKSMRWTGQYSRRAQELYDWLERSPREERAAEVQPA